MKAFVLLVFSVALGAFIAAGIGWCCAEVEFLSVASAPMGAW